jgi:hypothetical protein
MPQILRSAIGAATLILVFPLAARATDGDAGEGAAPPGGAHASAGTGSFLALTQSAALDPKSAYGFATGGYDSARGASLFEAAAEVRVWGPLAVRGGAVFTGGNRLRPSLGARVQALREARHGVDGTLGVFYRPEGLTEPEGELEAVIALGTHLGATYLIGNLVYGQDPEGRERDGELRMSVLRPMSSRLHAGLDARVRFDLGSSVRGPGEPKLDALAGPTAALSLGPVALLLQGGGSALRLDKETSYGAFVLGGMGGGF